MLLCRPTAPGVHCAASFGVHGSDHDAGVGGGGDVALAAARNSTVVGESGQLSRVLAGVTGDRSSRLSGLWGVWDSEASQACSANLAVAELGYESGEPAGSASSKGSPPSDCEPISCRCCARFRLSTRTSSVLFAVLSRRGTTGVSGGVQSDGLWRSCGAAELVPGELLWQSCAVTISTPAQM